MMMLLIILLVIVSVVLGFFVLIQNPKGGGLAPGSSASNMFGVQRTGNVLEKGSWVLIALMVVLSLSITAIAKNSSTTSTDSKIKEQLDKTVAPSPLGAPQPAQQPAADAPKK